MGKVRVGCSVFKVECVRVLYCEHLMTALSCGASRFTEQDDAEPEANARG